MKRSNWLMVLASACVLAFGVAACGDDDEASGGGSGGGDLAGSIRIDGSSTVAPLTEAIAEEFEAENSDVRVTVGTSGTGGGFEKFCAGETDISDASRAIEPEEIERLQKRRHRLRGGPDRDRRPDRRRQPAEPGQLPHRRAARGDLGPGLQALQLEPDSRPRRGIRRGAGRCSALVRTRAPSTTSPRKSTVRRAPRARTTTTSARTTTPRSPASRARPAAWATSASPSTRKTKTP